MTTKNKPKRKSWVARIQQSRLQPLYEFEMTYRDIDVKTRIDEVKLQMGLDVEQDYCPVWLAVEAYDKQDLIIALKCGHLHEPEYWEIAAQGVFLSPDETQVEGIPFYVELPKMSHHDVLYGSKTVKVNRGGGIKTRWAGLVDEILAHYTAENKKHYLLQYTEFKMLCKARFLNLQMYQEFNAICESRANGTLLQKLMNDTEILALDRKYAAQVAAAKAGAT